MPVHRTMFFRLKPIGKNMDLRIVENHHERKKVKQAVIIGRPDNPSFPSTARATSRTPKPPVPGLGFESL